MDLTEIKQTFDKINEYTDLIFKLNKLGQDIACQKELPLEINIKTINDKLKKEQILDSDGSLISEDTSSKFSPFGFILYGKFDDDKSNYNNLNLKLSDVQLLSIIGILIQSYTQEREKLTKELKNLGIKI